MKKYLYILLAFVPMMWTACNLLDQPPYDDFTDEEFWQSEAQARSYMYGFYTSVFAGYGTASQYIAGQAPNDDLASDVDQQDLQPLVVPVSDGGWSFSNVRKANYVIANVNRLPLSDRDINHWMGVARFFRACYYSNLVFAYGDVPWFDKVPVVSDKPEDLAYLYKDRDPRTSVDSLIMEDFQFAMDNVRENDGQLQVNRYVVAGMASRMMLREGTFLKYHNINQDYAIKCLQFAKDAADMVINSGRYSIAPSYKALFTSDNLAGNPEMLMYRHYVDGVLSHAALSNSFTETQGGLSKSLAEAFVRADGKPVYVADELWVPRTAEEFFANRDPRLSQIIRPKYYIKGTDCSPFAYALSGLSWCKHMDDSKADKPEPTWTGTKNVTDAPCLRYAEVLLNQVEAAYELYLLGVKPSFINADLAPLNMVRARADVNLPPLTIAGDKPEVNGVAFDDPLRLQIEQNADGGITSPVLWEIRRERRVELCLEGFRLNDLKRWRKLDYLWNTCNPDIRYGAYIVLSNYPGKSDEIVIDGETEGYILRNTEGQRNRPIARNYISPIPSGQISLYKSKGFTLTQNKEWE